eukprot:m.17914 g.17914  ORF g.17914 m.17914 type:complete len:705 (+) comp3626_c0_seq1:59-2173(+)
MRVVGLVSGGKDSIYNLMECRRAGHELVAIANLRPVGCDEMDSFMYQTVGHEAIDLIAEALGVPLFRRDIRGTARVQGLRYDPTKGDEVEDLADLLADVCAALPEVEAVSVGAILSDYQRVRVEAVCARMSLVPLAYLWQRNQRELLREMCASGLDAVLIKVAAMGLSPRTHLGRSLAAVEQSLLKLEAQYGVHVCGEGGEFETLVLDAPIFRSRIVIDESETVIHSDDAFAPVAYLRIKTAHLEPKPAAEIQVQDDKHTAALADTRMMRLLAFPVVQAQAQAQAGTALPVSASDSVALPAECATPLRRSSTAPRWFCNIRAASSGALQAYGSVEDEARATLERLCELLAADGLGLKQVVLMHLFVADMGAFARVNAVYKEFFGTCPPARVCVQLDLPSGCGLKMDAVALPGDTMALRHLHVQSLSCWAPANIGPYGQAVSRPPLLFLAGQIGLVPVNGALVEGIEAQSHLSVEHVAAVLQVQGSAWTRTGAVVCYLSSLDHESEARAALEQACGSDPEPILRNVIFCQVPRLPRSALVEWHAHALATGVDPQTVSLPELSPDGGSFGSTAGSARVFVDVCHAFAVVRAHAEHAGGAPALARAFVDTLADGGFLPPRLALDSDDDEEEENGGVSQVGSKDSSWTSVAAWTSVTMLYVENAFEPGDVEVAAGFLRSGLSAAVQGIPVQRLSGGDNLVLLGWLAPH